MSRQPYEGEFRLAGQPPQPRTLRVEQPYVVGVHLAPVGAPSALVLICRTEGATAQDPVTHRVEQMMRWPAGRSTEALREPVAALLKAKGERAGVAALVVNATDISEAEAEVLNQAALTVRFEQVQVTSGTRAVQESIGWRVPERDLVGVLQLLLAQGRLKAPRTLPLATELAVQLKTLALPEGPQGRDRHRGTAGLGDDLVTALALACWWGERIVPARVEAEVCDFSAWCPEALRSEYKRRRIGHKQPPRSGPSAGSQMLDGVS